MRAQLTHTIARVFRVVAASALLPLMLTMGLLSSPISCQCGSPLPHEHSLFSVASHTHTRASDANDHHEQVADVSQRNAAEAASEGPTLGAPADHAHGHSQHRALAMTLALDPPESSDAVAPQDDARRPRDVAYSPEPPPPQS